MIEITGKLQSSHYTDTSIDREVYKLEVIGSNVSILNQPKAEEQKNESSDYQFNNDYPDITNDDLPY